MTFRRALVIACFFSSICIAAFAWFRFMGPCRAYRCINIPDKHWVIADTYEDTETAWRGALRSGTLTLRLKLLYGISPSQSEEITTIHTTGLLGMYDVSLSPYPGAISQTIRCDDSFKPVLKKINSMSGQEIVYFSGLLNSRLQYGSCAENQIVFRSYVGMLYCEHINTWAEIELIVPKDSSLSDEDGEEFIQSVSCKK